MYNWKKIIALFLLVFIVIGGIYTHGMYKKYKDTLRTIQIIEDTDPNEQSSEDKKKQMEPFSMILFGLSERKHINDPGRPDTIILALVDPNGPKLSLISIPRDTYVDIPGQRMDKLNYAYARGGANLLVKTVEEWLDIEIKGYTSINFQGFIDLVDLVGGIDVYVSRDMRYEDPVDGTDIDLKIGQQKLDGKNALDFVRFRKSNDGRHASDYERMGRQQEALRTLGGKLVSIRSIARYYDIMNILKANVRTTLTAEELDKLLKTYYNFSMDNLETTSVIGNGVYINRGWYEQVSQNELDRIKGFIEEFFTDTNE